LLYFSLELRCFSSPRRLALFHFAALKIASRNAENKVFLFRQDDLTSVISAIVKMQMKLSLFEQKKKMKE